jgi:hypothetical protein
MKMAGKETGKPTIVFHANVSNSLSQHGFLNSTSFTTTNQPLSVGNLNDYWEHRLSIQLYQYFLPIIIFIGIMLNFLTILVLVRRKFGTSSTRILLISLALFDTGALCAYSRRWILLAFMIDVRTLTNASCPLHVYVTYVTSYCSSWTIALLTLERVVSVVHPLKARVICTTQWTVVTISITYSFIFILCAHILRYFKISSLVGVCIAGKLYSDYSYDTYRTFWISIWHWIDLLVYACIPIIIIITCNALIVYKVKRSQRLQSRGSRSAVEGQPSQLTSITYMLVTVSVAFVLLTLPSSVYMIYKATLGMYKTFHQFAIHDLIFATTFLISTCNNAINFLLYCVSGTQFRREVYLMFRLKGT